jgi:membrane protein YdbS with pleckstrin-like domain
MSIPLKNWHRLGKKTFWIFFLRHSRFFFLILIASSFFTYSALWGRMHDSFNQFFLNHADWYISASLVLTILWLALLGYLVVIYLYSFVLYRQYKFMLDEHAFYIRRGIFFTREFVIPYRQIQNVEINRPYLYRLIGLAELDLTTLSSSSEPDSNLHKKRKNLLPVIDYRIAKILARNLVQRGTNTGVPFVEEIEYGDVVKTG